MITSSHLFTVSLPAVVSEVLLVKDFTQVIPLSFRAVFFLRMYSREASLPIRFLSVVMVAVFAIIPGAYLTRLTSTLVGTKYFVRSACGRSRFFALLSTDIVMVVAIFAIVL